jgi:signal transduction histidine kinase
VCLSVEDSGIGIPDSIRQRIYDPFFTTKPVGKGTGLGLNSSYDIIVNQHKGVIDVQSKLGEGSTFLIKLPLSDAKV